MYKYFIKKVLCVTKGDTIECLVDLGFGIFHRVTIKLAGFNALEPVKNYRARKQAQQLGLDLDTVVNIGRNIKDILSETIGSTSDSKLVLESKHVDDNHVCYGIVRLNETSTLNEYLRETQERLIHVALLRKDQKG